MMWGIVGILAAVMAVCLAGLAIEAELGRRSHPRHRRKSDAEIMAELAAEKASTDRLRGTVRYSYDYDVFSGEVLPFTAPADDDEPWPPAAAERLAHTADLPAFTPERAPEATIDELVAKAHAELDELWETACQKFGVLT